MSAQPEFACLLDKSTEDCQVSIALTVDRNTGNPVRGGVEIPSLQKTWKDIPPYVTRFSETHSGESPPLNWHNIVPDFRCIS